MDNTPQKQLSLAGMFYRRKDDWIRHVIKLPKAELSHVEKLVAIYIAETINPEAREWITSQGRIAEDMDIGIRVVKSAVSKLRNAGLISVRRVRMTGKQKRFNSYAIVAVEDAVPISKVHGRAPT